MLKISQLWADKIMTGDRKYKEVPAKLRTEVAQILAENDFTELITEE